MPEDTGQPESGLPASLAGSLERGRFTYFPVVPGRLEFAIEVRQAILRERPGVIAVELPATLEAAWLHGVSRLPQMSAVFYQDEGGGEDAFFLRAMCQRLALARLTATRRRAEGG